METPDRLRTIFGRPIIPNEGLYPHPTGSFARPLFYREQYLRKFSASFREEDDWTIKITDRSFVANKLREAASADGVLPISGKQIHVWDKEDINFIYKELMEKYKPYDDEHKETRIRPSIDGVWRVDGFCDENSRGELIKAAVTLENSPQKKWHPESNQQLLDLVHPSWWPIVYGRTRTIEGETVYPPKIPGNGYGRENSEFDYSTKFCWLPSEFEISENGKTRIASYINNLALPDQNIFYPILEDIFSKFVPLFNHVLADLRRYFHDFQRVDYLNYKESDSGKSVPENTYKESLKMLLAQFEEGEELTVDIKKELKIFPRLFRSLAISAPFTNRQVHITNNGKTVGTGWEPPSTKLLDFVKLQGTTARVIVKMATIILTPEKPKWEGGPWHVEALKNERIVATGIYYYDQENITPSSLAFRRALKNIGIDGPKREHKDRERDISEMYNTKVKMDSPASQEIGSIPTKENRAIVFPNIFQHRIEPFELVDNTRNGYRRILAFFLCDPTTEEHKIPTTKTIPPQQPDVQEAIINMLCKTGAGKLPLELFQIVTKDLPPAISLEEAQKYKEELTEERTKFRENSRAVNGQLVELCKLQYLLHCPNLTTKAYIKYIHEARCAD
ncbi:hypothetical protein AOL_s00006g587 [Orbilia oligospora ATCC 24927]|uniref:Uncharacterized protein n=1 Tax=Arthrobotrys oligospora (strain ATCC 24927 / CBS 115.81 / DSM 1491) TaxID=756982 RepID=G1X136_ARTOA|nr:hypothetical protein AOL_s00006g587 [Orbilia oligospora ATCC 24927]EGX53209.1 hypothetical protein AOL_s00006g587 [Orbilia oligospora ATCC 24927]